MEKTIDQYLAEGWQKITDPRTLLSSPDVVHWAGNSNITQVPNHYRGRPVSELWKHPSNPQAYRKPADL